MRSEFSARLRVYLGATPDGLYRSVRCYARALDNLATRATLSAIDVKTAVTGPTDLGGPSHPGPLRLSSSRVEVDYTRRHKELLESDARAGLGPIDSAESARPRMLSAS